MVACYDAIVLGVGGVGSGAMFHLARKGQRVLGIDRFGIPNDRGSSHGETRIIRKAYFEHPDYVPLLHRAYHLWHDLESRLGTTLLHPVGLFLTGEPASEAVAGTLEAAEEHGLALSQFTAAESRSEFPGFHFPDEFVSVFEDEAGFLEVENCVQGHVHAACRLGAEVHAPEQVLSWQNRDGVVRVVTDAGEYETGCLIVTAGPWSREFLPRDFPPLAVVRKPVVWFDSDCPDFDIEQGCPTFLFDLPRSAIASGGQFYGFPSLDGQTVKVAEHTGGPAVADPSQLDRELHDDDWRRVGDFARKFMPGLAAAGKPLAVKEYSVCMYTKSPDGHFIIDRHPEHENILIACGFSGHGFKFTSVIGEALAEMACDGETLLPIQFLSLERFRP